MGPTLRSIRLPHLPTTRFAICLCGLLIAAGAPAHASGFAFRDTYARPEILADVTWLAERIGDPTVRVVDARVPFEWALYEAGHIPGAVFADMFFGVPILPASAFADAMGQLGIDDDTTVVIYDTDGGAWAARLWWALKFHGHDRAMMLNGGLRRWILAGLPIERTTPTVTPATFTPRTDRRWLATTAEVRAAIDDPRVVILDTLPLSVYRGDGALYGRPGHITTALSFPTPDTLDAVTLTLMPPATLSRMLARLELDPTRRTLTYGGGGFYGAHGAFVLYLMGFDDVALYAGSLMDWVANPANPMTTVP